MLPMTSVRDSSVRDSSGALPDHAAGEPGEPGAGRTASNEGATAEAASGDTASSQAAADGGDRRRTIGLHLAVFGGFVLLGVVLWWNVWVTGHPTTTITCQCGDPSQELWFLSWTPWAIIHGHSPFLTNAIYAGQGGANMMVNTSWMLPSIVLAPITWLFGPIASFNVAATVAPAISAWCFFLAARKVTTLVPAQILGGLLFGFSPFVIQNDPFGHLNFTLLFFPPLAFILLFDLVVTHRRSPVRTGVWLAALVVAEFFTSTELLAICILILVLALVVAAATAPSQAWALRARIGTAAAIATGITLAVLAFPAWFILAGPRHIRGFPWANSPDLGTTPSAIVNAGVGVHASSLFDTIGGYFGGVGPNSGPLHLPSLDYVGTALVVFLVVSAFTWYRSRLVWTIVAGTIIAWLFSFGTTLGTEGSTASTLVHPWWAPWRLFAHIPLVSDILPIRFGVMVIFGVAMLLAISLDRWCALVGSALDRRRGTAEGNSSVRRRSRIIAATISTVVGIALLVPVASTTSVPFTVNSSPLPAWFTEDAPRLAAGTIVLVVPFEGQRAEGWQAQTGLHFALAGGFAVVPDPNGHSAFTSHPTGAVAVLDRLSADPLADTTKPLPATAAEVATVRRAVVRWNVGATVVTDVGVQPQFSVGFFTAVYGRAPTYRHGVWVWTGSPGRSGGPISASTLPSCSGSSTAPIAPLAVAECVLRATLTIS